MIMYLCCLKNILLTNGKQIMIKAVNEYILQVPFRKIAYHHYRYSSVIEEAVNIQIEAEHQAAFHYLNMAVALLHPRLSRPGAGGFFMKLYWEELGHMNDFVQYQILRGGITLIRGLSCPVFNPNLTLNEAFTRALDMEKGITALLEELLVIAETVNDSHCADFITSKFIADQIQSLNEISHHITQISRLCYDEHALYHYDLELAKAYPYKYN